MAIEKQTTSAPVRKKGTLTSSRMNSKVLIVIAVLVLAVSFVPKSGAFTGGGGGNIPQAAKCAYEVSYKSEIASFYRHC